MPQMIKVTGIVVGLALGGTALAEAGHGTVTQRTDRTRAFTVSRSGGRAS